MVTLNHARALGLGVPEEAVDVAKDPYNSERPRYNRHGLKSYVRLQLPLVVSPRKYRWWADDLRALANRFEKYANDAERAERDEESMLLNIEWVVSQLNRRWAEEAKPMQERQKASKISEILPDTKSSDQRGT